MHRPITLTALALTALINCEACEDDPDPAPTMATTEVIHGDLSLKREGATKHMHNTAHMEQQATAITSSNDHGIIQLNSGA